MVTPEEPRGRTEHQSMVIFKRLVDLQDSGVSVRESHVHISFEFDLTPEEVAAIEKEGVARNWPPL